jgi:GNAT superfamily N-acetyltransferase
VKYDTTPREFYAGNSSLYSPFVNGGIFMTTTIRVANPNDADQLHALICELAQYQGHTQPLAITPESLYRQLSANPQPFECLIAERNDRVVGFALFFQNYSTWEGRPGIYLEDLYVRLEARGCGIGKLLLAQLTEIARTRNYARIDWNVIRSNTSAIAFYEGVGAKQLPDWIHHRIDIANAICPASA